MRTLAAAALACLLLVSAATAVSQQETGKEAVSVGFPQKTWALAFDGTGFQVKTNGLQPDGRAYLLAENETTKVVLSVFLEKAADPAKTESCQENQKQRLEQKVEYKREKVETRESAGMVIVEYTIPEFDGVPVLQRNLFACISKDDVFVDIHLSKTFFKAGQEALFLSVLDSAHFIAKTATAAKLPAVLKQPAGSTAPSQSSLDYFRQGSGYYIQGNYRAAIEPYQRALDLEKQAPRLSKNYWRVLVDNLGMAYGLTGDLDRAEETFNYGLSRDSTYPMFYYNLACASAERNDMEKSMQLLQKAFSYKSNSIPGEGIPDPRRDDSFQRFLGDQRFRQLVDSLIGSSE